MVRNVEFMTDLKNKNINQDNITNIENIYDPNHPDNLDRDLERLIKLNKFQGLGYSWPNQFKRSNLAEELHLNYDNVPPEELTSLNILVKIAGRIILKRVMGKASFITLQDMSGKIQVYLQQELLGELYEQFKLWDLGDIIGVEGCLFKTKTQELSVKASQIILLTKSLRPLPEKWHGLQDQEIRYRQRYLDLIVNPNVRKVFQTRTKIINCIREYLNNLQFLEVETPMMQVIPGGATARPFITHHNALNMDLYLRISPELYLKRLVVGGFEKVYEINRNFRNEGLSTRHNPEFTMIEFYQAFADYKDLMNLTEDLFKFLATQVLDGLILSYQGKEYNLSQPFKRLTFKQAIQLYNQELALEDLDHSYKLLKYMQFKGLIKETDKQQESRGGVILGFSLDSKPITTIGELQCLLYEETVEANLLEPTFITEYPIEISPLARRSDLDPSLTDRFELYIAGREIANGFSELNDPIDQQQRFQKQVLLKEAGNLEAMHYDADYVNALDYGLPPTAGEGIGIDRLVMLFCDQASIRDVLLFPVMRK